MFFCRAPKGQESPCNWHATGEAKPIFKCCRTCDQGHISLQTLPLLTHSQAQALISWSRCLPTFILGELWGRLCSTVAAQGYLGCSQSFTDSAWFCFTYRWANLPQTFPLSLHAVCSLWWCVGSSTACIVVLDRRSHRLHTCNLGDSGFLVVRGGEVIHRSNEQQHYFNTPFQLSIAPPGAEGAVLSDRWGAHAYVHFN